MISKLRKIKLTALLLTVILVLTMIPVTAFALGEPPVLMSAAVTPSGYVELTFDKEMAAPDSGAAGFLVVGYAGGNKNVSGAQLVDGSPEKILLTLGSTVKGGEAPWLSYTPGTVAAADGGLLAAIGSADITNDLPHPTLADDTLPEGTVGTLYNHTFTAAGGTESYSFNLEFGSLPAGFSLNQSTGVLSGTPSSPGTYNFDIRVLDSNSAFERKSFTLKINPAAANVCEISTIPATQYLSLDDALAAVQDGQTITLLQNINHNSGMVIDGKTVTLNPAGYTLNVYNNNGTGLEVKNGGKLLLFGISGEFNVRGSTSGVYVVGTGTKAEVTSAAGIYGAYAFGGGWITLHGSATGEGASGIAANARDGGLITLMGSAIGGEYGVFVADSSGASNASVSVGGNVSGAKGICVSGTEASNTSVSVTGNVTATDTGAAGYGVFVNGSNTNAEIEGNITAVDGLGAWADNGGEITVDGSITAADYIKVGSTTKTAAEKTLPTSESGYHTYTDGTSTVWVMEATGSTGNALWNNCSPLPSNHIIEDIKYINGKYMAVGYNGTLIVSSDGENWQKVNVGTDIDRLGGIAYGNGKYVLVGHVDDYAARIYTSADGETWHETAAVPHHWLHDVAFGNGKFIAVGKYGKILVSSDGETWETKTVTYPADKKTTLLSVIYADGKYVAAGMGATTADHEGGIMTSSDGENWEVTYSDSNNTLWDVTYGNGAFVAVGGRSTGSYFICSSSNGTTWQANGSSAGYAQLFSVDYDGSQFIAVGSTNSGGMSGPYKAFLTTSSNGTNWSYGTSDTTKPGFRAFASNGDGSRYVAMGSYGNIYTSDNGGTDWSYRTLGTTKTLKDIAWNGSNLYVSVGVEGTIQTSGNGRDWTIQTSGTVNDLNKIDYLNGQFIAVGKSGTILTSADGTSWTARTTGVTQELKGLAFGGGKYVIVGGDSSSNPVVLTSTDGESWNIDSSAGLISRSFVTVAYGDGAFLAVMQYGQAYRYENDPGSGEFIHTRVADLSGSGCYPADIIYAGGKFTAVGGYGEIYISSDNGGSWTVKDSDLDSYSYGIAYGGGNFAAVGELGKIIASADEGATWLVQPSGLIPNHYSSDNHIRLNGIAAGDGCFVAVGEDGIILQSESFIVSDDADANDVAVARAALQINGSGANNIPGYIVSYLTLTTDGLKDTTISWQSSKPQYVANNGTVTRPAYADGDQVVYLTATISKGSSSAVKTFIVDVIAETDPDISDVNTAAAALTFDVIKGSNIEAESITSNLNLPTSGINGTTISWQSSKPSYITIGGAVTRPSQGAADEDVILIATVTKGSASQAKQFTVRVKAMPSSPPSSGSTGSGGGSSSPPPSYQADVSGSGNVSTLPVSVNTGSNSAAVTAGTQQGESVAGGNAVVVDIPSIPGVLSFTLEIPSDYLSVPDGKGALTLTTDAGSVTMPSNMLADTDGKKAQITIRKGDPSNLTDDMKAIIGNRPLVQLTLSLDGQQTDWSNPAAPVTVTIPYAPTPAEQLNPEGIVIWYIDGNGSAICVPNGRYDPVTSSVTFSTTHFSDYAVAYKKADFHDVKSGSWYHKPISFIAARDITSGTGSGNFSPDAKLTRGQFIVMVMKAYGITPDKSAKDNFNDAGNTWYTGYLAAARRLGISEGTGNNMFAPGKEITRQEMFTLLYNTLEKTGRLPDEETEKSLSAFSDEALIKPWAREAVSFLTESGIIGGSGGKLNPAAATTRAEMAQVLYNLLSE